MMRKLKQILVWYCDRTSFHGSKYITNHNSSVATKYFFMLVTLLGLTLSINSIFVQFQPNNYAILNTIVSMSYPIWKVRFPSVTICNFNMVFRNNTGRLLNIVTQRGVKEEHFYEFLQDLSALIILDNVHPSGYEDIMEILNELGYTTDKLMEELAQPCSNMLKQCSWDGKERDCSQLFKFVKTSQGYCCSFNYYGTQNKLEVKSVETKQYKHVRGPGNTFGLRVLLDVAKDQYVSSVRPSYGFNVLIQDGLHYPDMEVNSMILLASQEHTISVTPTVLTSEETIRDYDINKRCCLFHNEVALNWTSVYSDITCKSECKANAILQLCGCLPFYYPYRSDTRICTLFDVDCIRENIYNYSALPVAKCDTNVYSKNVGRIPDKQSLSNIASCVCYPQCDEMMYRLTQDRSEIIDNSQENLRAGNVSRLNVYYDSYDCFVINKRSYRKWYQTLGAIGGMVFLCSGGSIISVLELLYFVFIKILVGKPLPSNSQFYVNDFAYQQSVLQRKLKPKY